jgi:hypothetical protein
MVLFPSIGLLGEAALAANVKADESAIVAEAAPAESSALRRVMEGNFSVIVSRPAICVVLLCRRQVMLCSSDGGILPTIGISINCIINSYFIALFAIMSLVGPIGALSAEVEQGRFPAMPYRCPFSSAGGACSFRHGQR